MRLAAVRWESIMNGLNSFYFWFQREVATDKWASEALTWVFIRVLYTLNVVLCRLKCWYDMIFINKRDGFHHEETVRVERNSHWRLKNFIPSNFNQSYASLLNAIAYLYEIVKSNYALRDHILFLKPNLFRWYVAFGNREMNSPLRIDGFSQLYLLWNICIDPVRK